MDRAEVTIDAVADDVIKQLIAALCSMCTKADRDEFFSEEGTNNFRHD